MSETEKKEIRSCVGLSRMGWGLLCGMLLVSSQAWAVDFAGGTGETDSPYEIATPEQLIGMGQDPNLYDKHFRLVTDLDLGAYSFTEAVIAPRWSTGGGHGGIVWHGDVFSGVLEGDGFAISNLHIQGDRYVGLFGQLGPDAHIRGVGLLDVEISGQTQCIGGLAGQNSGLIMQSWCTGSVVGEGFGTGGLVGDNDGVILGCQSEGVVVGGGQAGGLAGSNQTQGFVVSSLSHAEVLGTRSGVGGLVGQNFGQVINCLGAGSVSGLTAVGGLVGWNVGGVTCSYSTGSVTGDANEVGGLVGEGRPRAQVVSSFWNTESSGLDTSVGGKGLTTDQMQDRAMFIEAGWDFSDETANGTSDYWDMPDTNGPPVLTIVSGDQPPLPEGQGIVQDPFVIRTSAELGAVWHRPLAHFELGAHIDLSGVSWTGAVVPWFGGHFDGHGFFISSVYIQGALGLFGHIGSGAQVRDLGIVAVDILGYQRNIGVLAGRSEGCIVGCASTGSVNGLRDVGGLVGWNQGHIIGCRSAVSATADAYGGGLVGTNDGDVRESYSMGRVNGNYAVGGLVGFNLGHVVHSYSMGAVEGSEYAGGLVGRDSAGRGSFLGSTTRSFWDVESSGLTESAGGTGLTTDQMKDRQTFAHAGWDFVGDIADGTADVWLMPAQTAYPELGLFADHVPPRLQGSGTTDDPFLLTSASELGTLWYRPQAHYRLVDNIDLAGSLWTVAVVPWFEGTFDGNRRDIENLHILGQTHLGLFGKLGPTARIDDLELRAADITGTDILGSLAGINEGQIVDSVASGTINGRSYVGGLAGENHGDITHSRSSSTVRAGDYTGNLVGNNRGTIVDSRSDGVVRGDLYVGGLAGSNQGVISRSHSHSTVHGDRYVGGLSGRDSGEISQSRNSGTVFGMLSVGGLTGQSQGGTILNCYSEGTIAGTSEVGGLVGRCAGHVISSYSTGVVLGTYDVGGLVGFIWRGDRVDSSVWDFQTSGVLKDASGTRGLPTADMMSLDTYLEQGWDFDLVWRIRDGHDYPRLQWER